MSCAVPHGRGFDFVAPTGLFNFFNPYRHTPEFEAARWHPERETLAAATLGASQTLGHDHRCTKALARAAQTGSNADLWNARFAVKQLRRDQRNAIAAEIESA